MGSIGPMELLVVLVIALLVFGPKKLPEIGRGVGSAIREFRRHSRDLMSYLEEEPEPRAVYPQTTPLLRPADSASDREGAPAMVSSSDEEAPAAGAPPSPSPSNTHPTT